MCMLRCVICRYLAQDASRSNWRRPQSQPISHRRWSCLLRGTIFEIRLFISSHLFLHETPLFAVLSSSLKMVTQATILLRTRVPRFVRGGRIPSIMSSTVARGAVARGPTTTRAAIPKALIYLYFFRFLVFFFFFFFFLLLIYLSFPIIIFWLCCCIVLYCIALCVCVCVFFFCILLFFCRFSTRRGSGHEET